MVVQGASIVEAYDYDPWGVRLEDRILAGPTKEGFTTKERDAETGLDYFGARYYMAALGRWTSVDPVVDGFPSWSPYNYTLNNPVLWTDPDGRCLPWCALDFAFKLAVRHPVAAERIATLITQEAEGFACGAAGDCTTPPPSGGLGFLLGKASLVAPTATAGRLVGVAGVGDEVVVATGARSRVQVNKTVGDAFENAVGAELKATNEVVASQVTIKTPSGVRTRVDFVIRNGNEIRCIECKASQTARFTRNQRSAFPEIQQSGGVVVGTGKPGVPGGSAIPPRPVEIRRPISAP